MGQPCVQCGASPCNGQGEAWTGSFAPLLAKNKEWRESMLKQDPSFFNRLANTQAPEILWIGCADSRVPANQILDLGPGEVFVQRNVGNLATHKDMNCMACVEYTVDHLKVKHIMVVGHYNCGAVKASLAWEPKVAGLVNLWIADIRDTRNAHKEELEALSFDDQWDRLCELNVVRQVVNVSTSPIVQAAWARGQELAVHGLIYHPGEGLLKELTVPVTSAHEGLSMESVSGSKAVEKLSKEVNDHLRVHMSFTQPAKASSHRPVRAAGAPLPWGAPHPACVSAPNPVPGCHRPQPERFGASPLANGRLPFRGTAYSRAAASARRAVLGCARAQTSCAARASAGPG